MFLQNTKNTVKTVKPIVRSISSFTSGSVSHVNSSYSYLFNNQSMEFLNELSLKHSENHHKLLEKRKEELN